MVFLLGAVACTSLVNIVLAFASRRGWDGRAVLGWSYFASAALAGLMAALQAPALSFPAPGQLAGALTRAMTPASSMSFAVWFGLLSGGLYLLCLVTVEKSVREKGAGVTTLYQRLGILVPILCSALLWGEVSSAVQLAGLAASVAVMAALWGGGGRAAAKGPLAVFLLGGAVEFTGKVFQKCALAEYRPVFLFVPCAACAVLALPRLVRAPKLPPAGVALGAAMGACSALSSLLMMNALETVPPRRGLPGAERGLGGGGDGGGRAGLSPRPHPPGKAGPGFVLRVPRAGEPVNKWICARLQNPVKYRGKGAGFFERAHLSCH